MALVRSFQHRPDTEIRFRTEVHCGYSVGNINGTTILHLETYGSSARAIPGKVSQSIELDERSAKELLSIIRSAFRI